MGNSQKHENLITWALPVFFLSPTPSSDQTIVIHEDIPLRGAGPLSLIFLGSKWKGLSLDVFS